MAAEERIELDDETKRLCRQLIRRLRPRARRGEMEIRFEMDAGEEDGVAVRDLFFKERFAASELAQFDREGHE